MNAMTPARKRRLALALGIPAALAAFWCLLMQPEAQSVVAPLFGPWAGHLYGHDDCTLASAAPSLAWGGIAFVGLALFVVWRAPHRAVEWICAVLGSLVWSAMAALSVANTTS